MQLEKEGALEEALKAYEKAIAEDPKNTKAWYNKMLIHQKLKQTEAAFECAKTVLAQNPSWGKFVKDHFAELVEELEAAQRQEAQAGLLITKVGAALFSSLVYSTGVRDWSMRGLEEPAYDFYKSYWNQWERDDKVRGDVVKVVIGPSGIIESFSVKKKDPYTEALKQFRLTNYKKAKKMIESALKSEDHYGLWTLLGIVRNKLGSFEEALAAFETAATQNPWVKDIWAGMSIALNELQDPEKAKLASQIADISPIQLDLKGLTADELLEKRFRF